MKTWLGVLDVLMRALQEADRPGVTVADILAYHTRVLSQTEFPLALIALPPTQKVVVLKPDCERTIAHDERKLGTLILCQTFLKPLIEHIEYGKRNTTRCIIWLPEDTSQRMFVIVSRNLLV